MIVTIDGYDGTGKTTLAKKLAEKYGLIYVYKPFICMNSIVNKIPYAKAIEITKIEEKELWTKPLDFKKITKYYCDAFLWLTNFKDKYNIILDRGILTSYAVTGYPETEEVFDYYVYKNCFFDGSIYLTADDNERVRRIRANDPNDPDLKHPIKWRDNNLEEYAATRNLNYHKISTDNKTTEEVFEEACTEFEKIINSDNKKAKSI